MRRDPGILWGVNPNSTAYANLPTYLIAAGHIAEAKQVQEQANAKKMDFFSSHQNAYALAFLDGNSSAMAEQIQWFVGKPEEISAWLSMPTPKPTLAICSGRLSARA